MTLTRNIFLQLVTLLQWLKVFSLFEYHLIAHSVFFFFFFFITKPHHSYSVLPGVDKKKKKKVYEKQD